MSFHSLERFGLGRAFAISIAFHVLLLWPIGATRQEAKRAVPLQATLLAPISAASVPPSSPASGKPASPSRTRPRLAVPRTPETVPVAATPVPAPAAVPVTLTADKESRSGVAASAAESQPAAAGLDAEDLRAYRYALSRQAQAHRRYPEQAIAAAWSGTVEVRVTVAAGRAQTPLLLKSSGHAVLDRAALDMLGRAVRETPVPEALSRQTFEVDLPVVFELPE